MKLESPILEQITAWADWMHRQPIGMTRPNTLSPPLPGLREANSAEEANAIADQDTERHWSDSLTEEDVSTYAKYNAVEEAIEKLEAKEPAVKLRSLLIHVYWHGLPVGEWSGIYWPQEAAMPRTLRELGWLPETFLETCIRRVVELLEENK